MAQDNFVTNSDNLDVSNLQHTELDLEPNMSEYLGSEDHRRTNGFIDKMAQGREHEGNSDNLDMSHLQHPKLDLEADRSESLGSEAEISPSGSKVTPQSDSHRRTDECSMEIENPLPVYMDTYYDQSSEKSTPYQSPRSTSPSQANEQCASHDGEPDRDTEEIMVDTDETRLLRRLSLNLRAAPKTVMDESSPPRRRSTRNKSVSGTGMEETGEQPTSTCLNKESSKSSVSREGIKEQPDQSPRNGKASKKAPKSSIVKRSRSLTPKATGQKKEATSVSDSEEDTSDNQSLTSLGQLVWAKMGSSHWWPALTISGQLAGRQEAKDHHVWVFWFGDHKISELAATRLRSFVGEYSSSLTQKRGNLYKRALKECLQECATRGDVLDQLNVDQSDDGLLQWAEKGFLKTDGQMCDMAPKGSCLIPNWIGDHMAILRKSVMQKRSTDEEKGRAEDSLLKRKRTDLKLVRSGVQDIKEVCISCTTEGASVVVQHPIFNGGLCEACKENYISSIFTYTEDGFMKFCLICGEGGELFMCDQPLCNRVYCRACISCLVGEDQCTVLEETNPWQCYICDTDKTQKFGSLAVRADWETNLVRLFRPNGALYPPVPAVQKRRRIKVLSVFDGLSTAKVALDEMGFDIELYITSETDENCNIVFDNRHSKAVTKLGDIFKITKKKIQELCPIDLLLGGAPAEECEEMKQDLNNLISPDGLFFYQYLQIRETINQYNKNVPLFWMFEKTSTMSDEFRNYISKFLGCAPVCLDSRLFSPLKKDRYYWGNLPGLHSPIRIDRSPGSPFFTSLHQHLVNRPQNVPRTAKVKKISEEAVLDLPRRARGRYADNPLLPVMYGDKLDTLWVIEIESLYGLPCHYTDFGPLSPLIRKKFLCQCWSIPLIKHLFRPLQDYFALKMEKNNNSNGTEAIGDGESSSDEPGVVPSMSEMETEPLQQDPNQQVDRSSAQQCKGAKRPFTGSKGKGIASKGARKEWYTSN